MTDEQIEKLVEAIARIAKSIEVLEVRLEEIREGQRATNCILEEGLASLSGR